MGLWSEAEARKRAEEALRKRREAIQAAKDEELRKIAFGGQPAQPAPVNSWTLFDAAEEQKRPKTAAVLDGFEALDLNVDMKPQPSIKDPLSLLTVVSEVRSIRGYARQEYGRIYGALAPLYFDIARSTSHMEPYVFQMYREPEHQARMLANLKIFSKSDLSQGHYQRVERLNTMMGLFENAALREFENGMELNDRDGQMKRYANVLTLLNGGQAAADLFVSKHSLVLEKDKLGRPVECFITDSATGITLEPAHKFFQQLSNSINQQVELINRVFPPSVDVLKPLLERIADEIITDYVTPLLDEAHQRNIEAYLLAVAGLYNQCRQFGGSIRHPEGSKESFAQDISDILGGIFETHIDLYLQEELDFFKNKCITEVEAWEKKISEEEVATESFYMATVNRQADKKDFLSSFKKVVMMPVNVVTALPSIPLYSPFAVRQQTTPVPNGYTSASHLGVEPGHSRSSSENLSTIDTAYNPPPRVPSPTGSNTELAAKVAIMNSRLAGISSLFSIEVALSLIHSGKSSLERAASFVALGGQTGEEAKEQCEAIFVYMVQILGSRHVKTGFDRAIRHLSNYDPKTVSKHDQPGVAPLVMFLELVSVGDLIQQMIDVFFEQELASTRLADRNDFLDPAVKEKKRFEQMLDERVAAGLNKGIDVLVDEVEYVCATTQMPQDYNPGSLSTLSTTTVTVNFGPSSTATQVVAIVSAHSKMLVGSTDKSVLDVFNTEVGLRLFHTICKHLKRQRISIDGSMTLISDMSLYSSHIATYKNPSLNTYYRALREVCQIFLIDRRDAKDMAAIIADGEKFHGIFNAEEVYEFAERRADWLVVRREVERAMYGFGCVVC
jgi:recyclin-1